MEKIKENPLYGDHHYRGSKIMNRVNGELFGSAKEAAAAIGVTSSTVHRHCKGITKGTDRDKFDLSYYPDAYKPWHQRMKEAKALSCYQSNA